MTKIIDLEAHFLTEEFVAFLNTTDDLPGPLRRRDASGSRRLYPDERKLNQLLDLGDKRIAEMDQTGIAMQVISLYQPPHIQTLQPAAAVQWAKQTNDALAKAVKNHPDRFAGLAAIPVQSPQDAVEELERSVTQLGLRGVCLTSNARDEYFDDRKYWCIFEKAEQLDVPVYLHPTLMSERIAAPYSEYGAGLNGPALGHVAEVSLHVMRLILSGLFDRFPGLKFMLGHMGEGLPYSFPRLDFAWNRKDAKRPPIARRPSDYIKRHFTVTTSGMFFTPALLCAYLSMGADRIGFAVDYPPEKTEEAVKFMQEAPICDADKEKIWHANAEALLKL